MHVKIEVKNKPFAHEIKCKWLVIFENQSRGFIVGKMSTSRMDAESVKSITRRSIPKPRPPVEGIPYSSAVTKS